ncbi:hydantoin racemase [Rhodobacterales bacterium HKCCE2091]|nr:hydantoin racemase [Rhodobacterales bacterium HKCCE2091]
MRIIALNPNSSTEVTALMDACLAPLRAVTRHEIVCTELPDAPIGIETDDHVRDVAPMVQGFIADTDADAVVVACFSDPGVALARAEAAIPVVGIAEAAYYAALQLGRRFGVVSLGASSIARHARHIEALGLTGRLAGDRSIGMTVAEGHSHPGADAAIRRVSDDLTGTDGADCLILGCAGLGARRPALQALLGLPVIDPVQAGVAAAITLLDLDYGTGRKDG